MPLDFPASPSLNDTYSFGGKTWIWNGEGWALQPFGAINGIPIGNATANTGNFTTLAVQTGVSSNLLPTANVTFDLGANDYRWNDLWLANSTIYIGNGTISANATSLILTNPDGNSFDPGGGGTPGGANTEVQFNDAGAFGATAGFTFDKTTNAVATTGTITATGNISGGNLSGTAIVGTLTTAAQTNITSVGTLTSLTSSGNIQGANVIATADVFTPEIVKTGSNGAGNIGQSNNTFNTVFAKATSAQYADVAERYLADADYPVGTVLVFGGNKEVTQSQIDHTTAIAGTVSDQPAYVMNTGLQGDHVVTVALLGRVPVRVIGTIRPGDLLVASELPGVATSLIREQYAPGCVIGKALESYDSQREGTIEVVVGRL